MSLAQVLYFADTNSVEATWVDSEGNQVKCHSYADVQMDMLEADLGEDAAQYADLIAQVKAGIKPVEPAPPVKVEVVSMAQARKALVYSNIFDADVKAILDTLPEPAKSLALIDWEFSSVVHRDNTLVATVAQAKGLTENQVDYLFTLASTL